MSKHPQIKWAETEKVVFVTLVVPNCKNEKISVVGDSLNFECASFPNFANRVVDVRCAMLRLCGASRPSVQLVCFRQLILVACRGTNSDGAYACSLKLKGEIDVEVRSGMLTCRTLGVGRQHQQRDHLSCDREHLRESTPTAACETISCPYMAIGGARHPLLSVVA